MKKPTQPYKIIGKKIEDFHWIYVHISPVVAKMALESSYGNEAEEIFQGLEIYHKYGLEVYMSPPETEEQ